MDGIYREVARKLGATTRRFHSNGTVALKMSHKDPVTGRIITQALYIHGVGLGFDGKIEKKYFFSKRKKSKPRR